MNNSVDRFWSCSSTVQLVYAPGHPALQSIMQAATSDLATLCVGGLAVSLSIQQNTADTEAGRAQWHVLSISQPMHY